MRGGLWLRSLLVVCAAVLVANCSKKEVEARINGRWGPNPAPQATDFDTEAGNQMLVLGYVATHYQIDLPQTVPSSNWMRVAEAGFNVGRQDCMNYMEILFRMARERQRNDSLLNAASLASNAILTATATGKAVSIVGASLGMATSFNDAIYDTYLFSQAPGLISVKVKDLQNTYQQSIENSKTLTIDTPEKAYSAIQNYYRICLPNEIEGVLLQKIADTTTTTSNAGDKPTQSGGSKPQAANSTAQSVKLK